MTGSERHHYDAPSPALHFCRTDDGVFRIISAFHDHVGLEMSDEFERRILGKNYDEIDALESRQHVRALGVRAHRAGWTLEAAY